MEEILTYVRKFKIALFILLVGIAIVVFLITHTIPEFQKISDLQKEYKTKSAALSDEERRLSSLSDTLKKEKKDDAKIIKAFFNPIGNGIDNDTAISAEFNDILQILRDNKIKTRTLKFDPDPKDDSFVIHASDKYYVSKLTADMIATYSDFENFLRDVYKHEHFLEISRIEIKPYDRNKRILLINLQLKLYAQKDPSTAMSSSPVPEQTEQSPETTEENNNNQSDANGSMPPSFQPGTNE